VTEIQEKLEKINELKKQNEKEASEKASAETKVDSATNNGTAYNLCTNVIILVMFGIFICIVKKIYESGEQDE
jgi:F0F1-type ATP synthase assembly protein I